MKAQRKDLKQTKKAARFCQVETFVRTWFQRIYSKAITSCFILSFHPHERIGSIPLSEWQWPEYIVAILILTAVVVGVWYIIGALKFIREIGK